MRRKVKKIVSVLLTIALVISGLYGEKVLAEEQNYCTRIEGYEKEYGVKYTELFYQVPEYLDNHNYNLLIESVSSVACNAYWDGHENKEMAEVMHTLETGGKYLIDKVFESQGIESSEQKAYQMDVAKQILKTYISDEDVQVSHTSGFAKKISGAMAGIEDVDSILKDGKALAKVMKESCTYLNSDMIEKCSEFLIGYQPLLSEAETQTELFKYIVTSMELQDMEYGALCTLINSQRVNNSDSSALAGLETLKREIENNTANHMMETYCTKQVIAMLKSTIVNFTLEDLMGITKNQIIIAKIAGKVIAFCYGLFNPTYKELKYAAISECYFYYAQETLSYWRENLRKKKITEGVEEEYRAAYVFMLATLKIYAENAKACTKDKDKIKQLEFGINKIKEGGICYNNYIKQCMRKMSEDIKSGILKIENGKVIRKDENGNVIDETYDSTQSIKARLDAIMKQYPPNVGVTWNGSWGGGIQCFGFARMVFSMLYGCEMPASYVNNARYILSNNNNVELVGRVEGAGVTESAVRDLFAKAKAGDVIQASGNSSQHTMIFLSCNDNGVEVYDCNAKLKNTEPDCVIHRWTINYSKWVSDYSTGNSVSSNGISVYRASNYASIYGDGEELFYDDSVNFVIENGVLVKYNGWQAFVTIPDTVTAIGDEAFMNNDNIMSVYIPETVKTIGQKAFYDCDNLIGIMVPDSVETIGAYCFADSDCFVNAYLPENNKYTCIEEGMFKNNAALDNVQTPDYISEIKKQAFYNSGLTTLYLNDDITKIGAEAFYNCTKLTDLMLPKYLEEFGSSCFGNCVGLESVEIPRYIIGCSNELYPNSTGGWGYTSPGGMFSGCDNLKKVTFAKGITKVGIDLFKDCTGLEEISFPDTVTEIQSKAFYNCTNLKKVNLPSSLTKIGILSFAGCVSLEEIDIPDAVTVIDCCAFRWCKNLSNVKLSTHLKEIGTWAFADCTALQELVIPKMVDTVIKYYDGMITTELASPFEGCNSLKKVVLQDGMKNISPNLFRGCIGLEEVVIPDSVIKIGKNAFNSCRSLKTLNLPDNLVSIEDAAFIACSSIEKIEIPDTVYSMGTNVFEGCDLLTEVKLPKYRIAINKETFKNCISLRTIDFPDSLQYIGSSAFEGCEKLESITVPEGFKGIESYAFKNCKRLTSVELKGDYIAQNAFENCLELVDVKMDDSIYSVGKGTFLNCASIERIHLSTSLSEIPASTFEGCTYLDNLVIPYGVSTVGNEAFKNCTKLKNITIPQNTASISANAFSYPEEVSVYGIKDSYAEKYAKENGMKFVEKITNVESAGFTKDGYVVNAGATIKVPITIIPENCSTEVVWTSSNEKIATVSSNGTVKGINVGECEITVAIGTLKKSCRVVVKKQYSGLKLNGTSRLNVSDVIILSCVDNDGNQVKANELRWWSSDPEIVSVNQEGVVTANKAGNAKIEVRLLENTDREATIDIEVLSGIEIEQPDDPNTPQQPDDPYTPQQPEDPYTPQQPENPDIIEKPDIPENPVIPNDPYTPQKPMESQSLEEQVYQKNLINYDAESSDKESILYYLEEDIPEDIKTKALEITANCFTDMEKLQAIHDWVANNIYYDYYGLGNNTVVYTSDKVFEKKGTIYQGYANLTASMCRAVGIPCKIVRGWALRSDSDVWTQDIIDSNLTNYAWNEAYMDDRWLILDTAWDSVNQNTTDNATPIWGKCQQSYFDSDMESFSKKHKIVEYSKMAEYFSSSYTVTFMDGESVVAIETVYAGNSVKAPIIEKEGYDLSWEGSYTNVLEDVIVRAVWTPKKTTVKESQKQPTPPQTNHKTNTMSSNTNNVYQKPEKVSGLTVKNKKRSKLVIKWSKQNQETSYQVQIATKKNFKKGKITYFTYSNKYTYWGYKGKKYYVRVRAYNDGSYGAWSKVKKIKIKK